MLIFPAIPTFLTIDEIATRQPIICRGEGQVSLLDELASTVSSIWDVTDLVLAGT